MLVSDVRYYKVKQVKHNENARRKNCDTRRLCDVKGNGYIEPVSYFPPSIRKIFFADTKDV